ncbi:MAG TPA: hypothetical protein VF828_04760 [Patescibacteria group bacterium]
MFTVIGRENKSIVNITSSICSDAKAPDTRRNGGDPLAFDKSQINGSGLVNCESGGQWLTIVRSNDSCEVSCPGCRIKQGFKKTV